MPNVRKDPEPESGMRRATDFQEGFMGVPGYSDDSLLSVVRYVSQAQMTLRKCDFDEFMTELKNIENATKAPAETPAARIEKIKEHRAQAMAKIAEFPELAAGFENFMMNSKRLRRQQNEAAKDDGSSGSR